MALIYIAGPYSKGDVAQNVKNALYAADALMDLGHTPFVPHLCHYWHINSEKSEKVWLQYGLTFLSFCDALLRLPGESKGADNEVAEAKTCLGIPVFYSLSEVSNWKL